MDNALSSLCKSNQNDIQVPTNQFLLNFIWINIKVCICLSICISIGKKYSLFLKFSIKTPKSKIDPLGIFLLDKF